MQKVPVVQLTKNGRVKAIFESYSRTQNEGFDPSTVRKVALGERNQTKGSVFGNLDIDDRDTLLDAKGRNFGKVGQKVAIRLGIGY